MAYNNKKAESIGISPFYAYHRKHPNLFERLYPGMKAEIAVRTAEEIKKTHEIISKELLKSQERQISYVNKKRKTAP